CPGLQKVRRLAAWHPARRDGNVAVKASIKERFDIFRVAADIEVNGKVGEAGADDALAHRHLPTAFSPILKRKLPRPTPRTAWSATCRRVRPMIVLPSGKMETYSPRC